MRTEDLNIRIPNEEDVTDRRNCDDSRYYSTSALLAEGCRLSVRPSVCPSRSGIWSRGMKIRSCDFQLLVGQSL